MKKRFWIALLSVMLVLALTFTAIAAILAGSALGHFLFQIFIVFAHDLIISHARDMSTPSRDMEGYVTASCLSTIWEFLKTPQIGVCRGASAASLAQSPQRGRQHNRQG